MAEHLSERETLCHIHRVEPPSLVGFVFICPGRAEEREGRPCAGQTGKVLDDGLSHLVQMRNDLFTSRNRYDYLITNAWPEVEHKKKTKRSIPKCIEVTSKQNIGRLFLKLMGSPMSLHVVKWHTLQCAFALIFWTFREKSHMPSTHLVSFWAVQHKTSTKVP